MIHLDSHPDMLLPKDLTAEDIYDKERIYEWVSFHVWSWNLEFVLVYYWTSMRRIKVALTIIIFYITYFVSSSCFPILQFVTYNHQYLYVSNAQHILPLLFSLSSIESWLLPMLFVGHISTLIWLKPVWATQMKDRLHSKLIIGRDKEGKIKWVDQPYKNKTHHSNN